MNRPTSQTLAWSLFRIRPGEGRGVVAFGLVAALLQMGIAVGFTASDALFLTQVGIEGLPVIYLLTPVVMATYVPIHAYLLGRLGVDRVMTLTLAVLAAGAGAIWWAVHAAPGAPPIYAAKLFSVLWFIGLYSLYWNWIDGVFDIQDAKRVYPMFSAGEAMGGVLGGVLAAFLVQARPVQDLFLVWAVLAIVAIPACSMVRRGRARLDSDPDEDATAGFLTTTRKTATAMRASPFVRVLGALFLTGLFLITVTEYQYLGILSEGAGEEELAALLGTLLALVSVFNVAVNLFWFNRLVLSVGVRNVALVAAVAYLAAFTLLLLEGGMAAAVVGFFTYHGVLASIEAPNQNFLFNAVREGERRQVRTILEGLAEPLATALGGAFLLFAATRLSPSSISSVGLGVAVAYLALVLLLRRRYGPSLAADLRRRWLDLSRPSEAILGALPPAVVATLPRHISDPDPAVALSALRILWMNDSRQAVGETLRFLKERPTAELQQARDLLGNGLDEADPEVARPLVEWILDHTQERGPGFIEELGARGLVLQAEVEHLLGSPDPDETASAVVVMWRSPRPHVRRAALDALLRLLSSDAPAARVAGVRALGHLGGDPLAQESARWLGDPDPVVRVAAATAVRNAAAP
ncbi:MAG: hypothetical protein FIA95_16720, partial [Gemmatimonadetes bacterium]|nr:hypothetical protein [Gemmatimonadota bacterium]